MARRGRPPYPGPLTPAEERVLGFVRDGMPNAEIAVRLGISVNTVRYHVSNLLGKAQAGSREELARWKPPKQRPDGEWRRSGRALLPLLLLKPAVLAAVGVVVIGAGMAGVIMAMGGAGDAPVADLPAPYTRPDAEALRSEGYLDTGPFLFTEDGSGEPVLGHSPREGFSALLVADEPLLVGETGRVIPRVYGPGLTVGSVAVRFEGELYTVELSRVRVSSTRLDGVARVEPLSDGELLISASAIEVPEASPADRGVLYDSTPTRQPVNHRATLSADGHLWLDPEAIAPGTATDEWTGALLDTAGAIEAGAVDPVAQFMLFTSCRGGVCSVSWRPALPPRAPIAGTLTCESSTRLRLDGTEVSLRFEWANTGYGGHPQLDCAPREVEAGEEIGPVRHWVITAYDRGGRQMSLAVSRDGRLFAGEFGPTVGCPCRSGN